MSEEAKQPKPSSPENPSPEREEQKRRLPDSYPSAARVFLFHSTVRVGDRASAQRLLDIGDININARDESGMTALHIAALKRPEMLPFLYQCGARIDAPAPGGNTALHLAAGAGSEEGVRYLLDLGADPRLTNAEGNTAAFYAEDAAIRDAINHAAARPVHQPAPEEVKPAVSAVQEELCRAAWDGDEDTVRNLLQLGVNPNVRDRNGYLALHEAARESHIPIVTLLLNAGAEMNGRDERGQTALHAVMHCVGLGRLRARAKELFKTYSLGREVEGNVQEELIEAFFLARGADVNAQEEEYGETALHVAARSENMDMVRRLLAYGANPTLRNRQGKTAAEIVRNDEEVQNHLKRAEQEWQAQRARDLATVQSLLADQGRPLDNLRVFAAEAKGERSIPGPAEFKNPPIAFPLHQAVRTGNKKAVLDLLAAGADVNARNATGGTALHMAAIGEPEILLLLLQCGAKIDALDQWGNSALHVAAGIGDKACVQHLLTHGANCRLQNSAGETAALCAENAEIIRNINRFAAAQEERQKQEANLCAAAENGEIETVRSLLQQGVNIHARNEDGETPLYLAAEAGHADIVTLLLDAGAQINARDKDGKTPLHLAAQMGHAEVVAILLEEKREAEINARDKNGGTPLHLAAAAGYAEIVTMLLAGGAKVDAENNDRQTPLHQATQNAVDPLLARGVDINARDSKGQTVLHRASRLNGLPMVQHLFARGADPTLEDKERRRAVELTRNTEKRDCIAYFERRHPQRVAALAEVKNELKRWTGGPHKLPVFPDAGSGQRPGKAAAHDERSPLDVAMDFLGGDVALPDPEQAKALRAAIMAGNAAGVRSLLEQGVDIEARDDFGRTALFLAVQEGHANIVTLLLQHRPDVNTQDKNGWTPLHRAAQNGDKRCVQLLLANGANRDLPNKAGRAAASYAEDVAIQNYIKDFIAEPTPSAAALVVGERTRNGMNKEKKEGKKEAKAPQSNASKGDDSSSSKCVIS